MTTVWNDLSRTRTFKIHRQEGIPGTNVEEDSFDRPRQ